MKGDYKSDWGICACAEAARVSAESALKRRNAEVAEGFAEAADEAVAAEQ
jgi:hypothetical protein